MTTKKLSHASNRVLDYLDRENPVNMYKLSALTGLSPGYVYVQLRVLEEHGLAEKITTSKRKLWRLTDGPC